MGEIHVQFESLQAGQAGIAKTYSALTATLTQLETDLKPMIDTWSGDAQAAYLVQKKNWDDAAEALAQVLNNIGRAVGDAHENYTATHKATTNIWS